MGEENKEKKKEYGDAALILHQEIKNVIDSSIKNNDAPCVLVSAIEKQVGKDPRTVRHHLKLLEVDEYGKLSKDGKMFCPKKAEEKR